MPELGDPHWQALAWLVTYSAAVVLASVFGGLLPEWIRLTHTRMQLLISFVGGVMLGIAVFHMIPHAIVHAGLSSIDRVSWGVMLGMLATFFLLRFFHFHQHGPADFGLQAEQERLERDAAGLTVSGEHTHICSDHNHPAHLHGVKEHARWTAVLVGLGLHTLMDGVALAASVTADIGHTTIAGFGTFLAIFLHKPLDAVSITSLMYRIATPTRRLLVNIGFALTCPVGAILFWGGAGLAGPWAVQLAAWGMAFSAGVFLCIALSDLLPEMEFHSHSRIPLTVSLLLGITLAWLIGFAEGRQAHIANFQDQPATTSTK